MTARAETAVGHQDRPSSPSKKVRTSFITADHLRKESSVTFCFTGDSLLVRAIQ